MAYKTVSGAQSAEIELDGSVYTVNFGHGYKYYAVRNDGSGTIYVSTTDKSCTPKNDRVVSIPSGGSYVHCNGYGGNPEIYFSGSGSAVVIAQEDGNNPFKTARKGGDKPDDFDMTGIEARFEAAEEYIDSTNKQWINMVSGGNNFIWDKDVSLTNDSVVVLNGNATCRYKANGSTEVMYFVVRKPDRENDKCVFGRGRTYSYHGHSVGLYSESDNPSFLISTYNSPYVNINADTNKWHLFTIVRDYDNLKTLLGFCDGVYYGEIRDVSKSFQYDFISLGCIFASTYYTQFCEYPSYFKFIAIGDLPIKDDKTVNYMDTVYKNMDWIMQNIVNPANEEV